MEQRKQRVVGNFYLFIFLHVSLKACHLCCHTTQTQDTERPALIKGIKCYSDSRRVGPHMKNACSYLAFMVQMCGLLSMTATYCTTTVTLQLSCSLNTHKQRHYPLLARIHLSEFASNRQIEKLQCKTMSSVRAMSLIFKCQTVPVFLSSPFSLTGKCPELVFHIFRLLALMKEFIEREEKKTEIELSHTVFKEQLLASDVTAGPSHCWPDNLRRVPVCLQHVNCVIMHNTKAKWPFMLYDVHLTIDGDDYSRRVSWYDPTKQQLDDPHFDHILLQLRKAQTCVVVWRNIVSTCTTCFQLHIVDIFILLTASLHFVKCTVTYTFRS